MKKIKLENLKVTSFVTTINPVKSKTIKGGGLTDELPVCNPQETNACTASVDTDCITSTDLPTCSNNGISMVRICAGTNNADCPRSGANAGTVVGCTQIC